LTVVAGPAVKIVKTTIPGSGDFAGNTKKWVEPRYLPPLVWNGLTGKVRDELPGVPIAIDRTATRVVYEPAPNKALAVTDLDTGTPVSTGVVPRSTLEGIQFSSNGRWLFIKEGPVVWLSDLSTGKSAQLRVDSAADVSPQGNRLITKFGIGGLNTAASSCRWASQLQALGGATMVRASRLVTKMPFTYSMLRSMRNPFPTNPMHSPVETPVVAVAGSDQASQLVSAAPLAAILRHELRLEPPRSPFSL
jgi:hypothetical protein